MRRSTALLLFLLALGLACGVAVVRTGWRLPDRWNPFMPLNIDEEPGLLTRYKLERLGTDPQRCLAVLATGPFRFRTVPDRSPAPGCAFDNAVRIERTSFAVSSPFTLSCPAAVSLALWERHVVQVAAERHFGQPVVRLDHVGSYACRNINGQENAPRSEHATANALDVSGFVLRSGRRIGVGAGWKKEDGDNASRSATDANANANVNAFLHESRDGACAYFSGVLSPDYNLAHASHLHLDRGPYRVCR